MHNAERKRGRHMNVIWLTVGALGTNCYIVPTERKNAVVIDPGADAGKIAAELEKAGLTLVWTLLTHGHHDHTGGVRELKSLYPDMKTAIGEFDVEMLNDVKKALPFTHLPDEALFQEDLRLHDGDNLQIDELSWQVLHTPGHTRGGVCLLCGDTMFAGDTLFAGEIGRCDLYGGDFQVMKQSLRKLAALPGDYHVFSGHGEDTTLEKERRTNYYMRSAVANADLD